MAKIILHIANANDDFSDELIAKIKAAFAQAKKFAAKILRIDNVDIFCYKSNWSVDWNGMGGFTPTRHLIYLNIDTDFKNIAQPELYACMCHELSHIKRYIAMNYKDYGADMTLLDYAIFEGLAVAIEKEVLGKNSVFSKMMTERQNTAKLVARFRENFNDTDYNLADFRDGNKAKNIPRWAIYEMGYYLVREKMKRSGKNASELLDEPVKNFINLAA